MNEWLDQVREAAAAAALAFGAAVAPPAPEEPPAAPAPVVDVAPEPSMRPEPDRSQVIVCSLPDDGSPSTCREVSR